VVVVVDVGTEVDVDVVEEVVVDVDVVDEIVVDVEVVALAGDRPVAPPETLRPAATLTAMTPPTASTARR